MNERATMRPIRCHYRLPPYSAYRESGPSETDLDSRKPPPVKCRPPTPGTLACSHRSRTRCGSADRRSGCHRRSRGSSAGSGHLAAPSPARAQRALAPATLTHAQRFLAVYAQQLLVGGCDALPRPHIFQTAIAEPSALLRQLEQLLPQRSIIRPCRLVTDHPAARTSQCTRPTLAHPVVRLGMGNGFPHSAGLYIFFMAKSFSMALPRMASANRFFSRGLSSSSDRSRCASGTFNPPEFRLPLVECRQADPVAAADLCCRHPGLLLL